MPDSRTRVAPVCEWCEEREAAVVLDGRDLCGGCALRLEDAEGDR